MTKEEYFKLTPDEKKTFRMEFAKRNINYVKRALCKVTRTGADGTMPNKCAIDAGGGTDNVKIRPGVEVYLKIGHLRSIEDAIIYQEHEYRDSNGEKHVEPTPKPRFFVEKKGFYISDERERDADGTPLKLYEILPSQFEDDFFELAEHVSGIEKEKGKKEDVETKAS